MSEDLRPLIAMGVIEAIDDTGQAQVAVVTTADGVTRAGVEVQQPFGLASNPPGDGASALMLSVGADPANFVLLHAGCAAVRFGNLKKGETVLYAADGSRVSIRQGGTIEVWGANAVLVNSGTVNVTATGSVTVNAPAGATITAAAGVVINGNVQINGSLVASGDISDVNGAHGTMGAFRTAYDTHGHPDPQGGEVGLPTVIV